MPTRIKTKPKKIARKAVDPVITEADIKEYVIRASERVNVEDLAAVVKASAKISARFNQRSPLRIHKLDAEHMLSLCADYWHGRYRKISFWHLAPVVVALNYVMKPIDIIPDFIPGFGQADDSFIFKECLARSGDAINQYIHWRRGNPVKAKRAK